MDRERVVFPFDASDRIRRVLSVLSLSRQFLTAENAEDAEAESCEAWTMKIAIFMVRGDVTRWCVLLSVDGITKATKISMKIAGTRRGFGES